MRWDQLLHSPPPTTGWSLDDGEALVVHRNGSQLHCASEAVPRAGFEVGSVGLQAVKEDQVTPILAKLKGATEGAQKAAVVVPSRWLRSYLMDIDRVPRREHELHEVVQWRLKRLLPVPAGEARLSVVRLSRGDGTKRLLVMVGVERAVAAVESAFASIGVEVGMLTTRLFAVVPRAAGADRPMLVIQHEEGFLSLILLVDSVPRLLRTKPLAPNGGDTSSVVREVALNLGFIRDRLEISGDIEVRVLAADPTVDEALRELLVRADGLVPAGQIVMPPAGPTAVVQRLGAARLAPAVAMVTREAG